MLTVPLSVFGGISFYFTYSIQALIFFHKLLLVILIGISTKNSILIVDWANQLKKNGEKYPKCSTRSL